MSARKNGWLMESPEHGLTSEAIYAEPRPWASVLRTSTNLRVEWHRTEAAAVARVRKYRRYWSDGFVAKAVGWWVNR